MPVDCTWSRNHYTITTNAQSQWGSFHWKGRNSTNPKCITGNGADSYTLRGTTDEQLNTVISSIPRSCHLGRDLVPSAAHRQLAGGIYRKSFLEESLRIVMHIKTQEVQSLGGLSQWFTAQAPSWDANVHQLFVLLMQAHEGLKNP